MGDIALRGNKLTKGPHGHGPKPFLNRPGQAQGTHGGKARGGRVGKFGGGRTNLLEELGRVEAEPSNRNRRAEISRVHGELNRGYAKGGRAGFSTGREVGKVLKKGTEIIKKHLARKEAAKVQAGKDEIRKSDMGYAKGGRIGLKHGGKPWGDKPKPGTHEYMMQELHKRKGKVAGGRAALKKGGKSDKKWIQKAVNPKHKGYCTPMTKKTCTPARKALARTFKKKAKTGW